MSLKHGAAYRAPDGRRFQATKTQSRHTGVILWTFVSYTLGDVRNPTLRDVLDRYLFLEKDRLYWFEFTENGPAVRDTGWTPEDLKRE